MHNASSDGPTPATSEGNTLSSVPASVLTVPSTVSSEATVTLDVPPPVANVPPEGQTVPTAGHMLDVGVNNLLCLFLLYLFSSDVGVNNLLCMLRAYRWLLQLV
ncbi:hypothetical protein ACQJBY_060351 [Aegilops geniculata]